jgi:L-lactate dehydrogenase complex protein LldE
MIRLEYPRLFADDRERLERAREVAGRTHELVSFLTDVRGMTRVSASCDGCAAYHDGCSGLRDLEIHRQPRQLLASVAGLRLVEVPNGDRCCGFGGTFSVKYSDISLDMVSQKTADVRSTGADLLLAGDLGCLLNIAGRLAREGSSVSVRHVAEVLDGQLEAPPIGRARGDGR